MSLAGTVATCDGHVICLLTFIEEEGFVPMATVTSIAKPSSCCILESQADSVHVLVGDMDGTMN